MCGFVGFSNAGGIDNASGIIKSMADTIIHRGPDDEGYYIDGDIALGFRRLSIIDLAGGAQPMVSDDGDTVLVFNGEIYNYRDIRADLIAAGHVFRTDSDSEVLLHGYEEYGSELPGLLRGMFAFVIWDKKNRQIFGCRDIFGIKPFYYYLRGNTFLFGSEIKSFLPHPDFVKELNTEMLPEYLTYEYTVGDKTMFRGVNRLGGGQYFIFKDGELSVNRYYEIHYDIQDGKNLGEWADEINRVFSDSVEAHRIADVEVGCFLSSGVDSSMVAKEVSSHAGIGGKPVKTFSVGYERETVSELNDAAVFADAIGLPNIPTVMKDGQFFDRLGDIQYFLDEPLSNPSEIPLFFLAETASKYVKVVLSGEGADELFGGYPIYLTEWHLGRYSRLPRRIRLGLASAAKKLPSFKGKHFLIAGAKQPWERYVRANYVFDSESAKKVLKDHPDIPDPALLSKPVFDKVASLDAPSQTQYADIHIWMAYDILVKADRMSMANSLELRVPFLDREVLETAMRIPSRFRAVGSTTKTALRAAAAKNIPERSAKMVKRGFPVPLDELLRRDEYYSLVRSAFESETAGLFFDREYLLSMLEEHRAGGHRMRRIWLIYSFLAWYNEFFVKR